MKASKRTAGRGKAIRARKQAAKFVVERVESGIPGLDRLVEGGFVKGSANLVSGQTGTGKTIFSCQYILHGLRNGEPGVYLTLEQQEDEIMSDVGRFGWDKEFKHAIDQKKFLLVSEFPSSIEQLKTTAFNAIRQVGAKRFVLDSLTIAAMGLQEGDVSKIRREVFDLIRTLKKAGVTSLLITEIPESSEKDLSRFGFEEFLADGVLILKYFEYAGEGEPRTMVVRKMRRTDHNSNVFSLNISRDGVKVSPLKKGIIV